MRLSIEKNCALEDLSLNEWRAISSAVDEDIFPNLALAAVLAMHDVAGGTAPDRVKSAIKEARRRVAEFRSEAPVTTVA